MEREEETEGNKIEEEERQHTLRQRDDSWDRLRSTGERKGHREI